MKKLISVLMALVLMFSFVFPAFAADWDTYADEDNPTRFQYVDAVYANATKKSFGFIQCTSHFTCASPNKTKVLYCYLQRLDPNGTSGWQNYKSTSITTTDLTEIIEKTWFAPSGYDYRTYTKVVVKNSSGTVLETATVASSVIHK